VQQSATERNGRGTGYAKFREDPGSGVLDREAEEARGGSERISTIATHGMQP